MSRHRRPAAYIRVARGSAPDALAAQKHAIFHAARQRGWPEPALYLDIGGQGRDGMGPALAQLTTAISTGQHDALILGGVGTICSSPQDLMRLLVGCCSHGVAVECATPAGSARGGMAAGRRQQPRGWT